MSDMNVSLLDVSEDQQPIVYTNVIKILKIRMLLSDKCAISVSSYTNFSTGLLNTSKMRQCMQIYHDWNS